MLVEIEPMPSNNMTLIFERRRRLGPMATE